MIVHEFDQCLDLMNDNSLIMTKRGFWLNYEEEIKKIQLNSTLI